MPSSTSVPQRYRDRTLDSYEPSTPAQKSALERAEAFVDGSIKSLVLVGPVGLGKTHIAAGIVLELDGREQARFDTGSAEWDRQVAENPVERRWTLPLPRPPVRSAWLNVPELVSDLRAEMRLHPEEQDATRLARMLRSHPGVVVLDDLGRENVTDWTGELVYTLVNARYEAGLRTIATSNLTPRDLHESGYWPAISRLAEDGALVEMDGSDHRLRRVS